MASKSIFKNPAVIAALIAAIAGIIVAIIQIMKPNQVPPPVPPILTYWGRIADIDTNKGIQNATITLFVIGPPQKAYSDSDGSFNFALGPGIKSLQGMITITADGYESITKQVVIESQKALEDIRIKKIKAVIAQRPETIKPIIAKTISIENDNIRYEIRNGNVTIENVTKLLNGFIFDKNSNTSIDEAKKMLISLGVGNIYQRDSYSISGKLEQSKEITIWPNSYNNPKQYGIRFGFQDGKYWGSNETLISINK